MKKWRWLSGVMLVSVLLLGACSGNEHKLLTKDTATSRDNTLVVMGIKWIETYNDTAVKEEKTRISYELLNDAELLKSKRKAEDKPELYKVLYYLNTFSFEFMDNTGKKHQFIRFGKDMRQYEPYALYEFKPGVYSLNNIAMIQNRFDEISASRSIERWKRYEKAFSEDFGSWELPAGKVVYLGDLTFHFKTKRFIFGFFTPEELIDSIKLEKVEIRNNFEEMKTTLQAQKTWFPVDEMMNLAIENEWVYTPVEESETPSGEETNPDKPKSDKSFY